MTHLDRMVRKNRKELLESPPPPTQGGIVLGQVPTPQQQQQMAQAQINMQLLGVAQNIFNQVVVHMLSTLDKHEQLTDEKMRYLAAQSRAVAPYVLQEFGVLQIQERLLPTENLESQLPTEQAESGK